MYPKICLFIFCKSNNSPFNLEHSLVLNQTVLQNRPVNHVLFLIVGRGSGGIEKPSVTKSFPPTGKKPSPN